MLPSNCDNFRGKHIKLSCKYDRPIMICKYLTAQNNVVLYRSLILGFKFPIGTIIIYFSTYEPIPVTTCSKGQVLFQTVTCKVHKLILQSRYQKLLVCCSFCYSTCVYFECVRPRKDVMLYSKCFDRLQKSLNTKEVLISTDIILVH